MAVKIDTEGCAVVIGSTADGCEVGVVDVDDSELIALDSAVVEVALVVEAVLEDGLTSGTEVTGRIGTIGARGLGTVVIAGGTGIDVVGDVDDSELVALDSAVVEVALVVEAVLEDGLTSGTEVTGRIGTIGARGLGTVVIAGGTGIDVVGDVTVSVMEKAVTDAVPEASSLSVIGAGKKFRPCEMQIVD